MKQKKQQITALENLDIEKWMSFTYTGNETIKHPKIKKKVFWKQEELANWIDMKIEHFNAYDCKFDYKLMCDM